MISLEAFMGLGTSLLYMVLLGFGSLITPGVGISGRLLEFFPRPFSEFSHVPAYGLLTWLLASGLRGREWPRGVALCVAVQAALVFGIWMEVFQGFVPGRIVEMGDVLMNAMGIGVASLLIGFRLLPIDEQSRRRPIRRLMGSKRGCGAS
jgi:VanZ family protein